MVRGRGRGYFDDRKLCKRLKQQFGLPGASGLSFGEEFRGRQREVDTITREFFGVFRGWGTKYVHIFQVKFG